MFDFDYKPPFDGIHPLDPEKLIWLAQARSKMMAKAMAAGQFTPATVTDIKEYLLRVTGLTPEEFNEFTGIGIWIAWDRETRDMNEEERAQYWADFNAPDSEPDVEDEEVAEDFRKFLIERLNERAAFDEITRNINKD